MNMCTVTHTELYLSLIYALTYFNMDILFPLDAKFSHSKQIIQNDGKNIEYKYYNFFK